MSEVVSVELKVGKELKEVIDLLASVAHVFLKDGKDSASLIAKLVALVPEVIKAVDGYDQLSAEVKDKSIYSSAGYLVSKLSEVLK